MNGAVQSASPYLDESWRRLVWTAPLAIVVWAAVLVCFALVLEQAPRALPELKPIEARIVELPPVVGGLQGGAAQAAHPAAAPARPKPRVEVKRKPMPVVHPHKPRVIPEEPPSPSGTSKAPAKPASGPAEPATKATTGSGEGGGGIPGAKGTGSGAGLGSDSLGARAIYSPTPKIPDDLREAAFQAVAMARFQVSYDGNVNVTLVKPTPDPRLNQILIDTLKQWRFFPAMKGGVAIDSVFEVRIPITVQ